MACVFWNKKATTEYEALPPVHPSAVSIGLPNRWSKLPDKRAGFELRLSKAFFPKTGEPQISLYNCDDVSISHDHTPAPRWLP